MFIRFTVTLIPSHPSLVCYSTACVVCCVQVDRINLHYAKRPKKVDFKRLKRNMWNLITVTVTEQVGAFPVGDKFEDSGPTQGTYIIR